MGLSPGEIGPLLGSKETFSRVEWDLFQMYMGLSPGEMGPLLGANGTFSGVK